MSKSWSHDQLSFVIYFIVFLFSLDMKGEGKFFTQIYDLLGLTFPVMVILVHVYDM